jgi:VWFA-related protein
MRRFALLVAALGIAAGAFPGQDVPSRLPPAETNTVFVDVVVRDGKGDPVPELTAADFEVREDGALQTVERFLAPTIESTRPPRAVRPADPAQTTSDAPATRAATRGATIALVFDHLSTESRVAAQRAARDSLRQRREEDVFGVFSVEDTLVVGQDFTADSTLVEEAIGAVGSRAAQSGASQMDVARDATGRRLAANAARAELIGMPAPTSAAEGSARAQAQINAARLSMAQAIADAFDHLVRDAQGHATAQALTAIVDALRVVPGRKAVVLFSEGLFRTEANEQRFLSVVSAANRASVSIYAIEAAGLQTRTYESLAREEIASTAAVNRAQQASGQDRGGGAFTRGLEAAEDRVRFSPRASLEWISDSTGGVFVSDTNDLSGALHRITSDLRSYYLLGYTPSNDTFDGRFRKISVQVRRRGLEVRARAGYFAVHSSGPVLAHVAPALALLEAGKRPGAVEVHAGAWPFPSGHGPVRVPVAVTVPGPVVARLASTGGSRRKGHVDVTLLARILAADGRPIEAMSRRFVFDPGGKSVIGDLCLLRDAWLLPGRYTLEAVAFESMTGQAGVTTRPIEVAEGLRPLDRMQVVIVRGALPAAEAVADFETGHPLRFGDVILQPLAGEALSRRPNRPLVFQLASVSASAGPLATIEVWQGTRRVTTSVVKWELPDSSGILRHVAEVPAGVLDAGRYELRVTLSDGAAERVLREPFIVSE